MFQMCTLERIPYIFLCNDAIDIYIILTESHDQGLSNKPIYNLRHTLVNEIHVEQSKCPKHLKHFWGHCTYLACATLQNSGHKCVRKSSKRIWVRTCLRSPSVKNESQ